MKQATHRIEIKSGSEERWYKNLIGLKLDACADMEDGNYWEVVAFHPDGDPNQKALVHYRDCLVIQDYTFSPPPHQPKGSLGTQVGGDHYKSLAIQPIEFIYANNLNFLEGCVVKRICRHRRKNGREDIEKAIHELQILLEKEYPQ